MNKKLVLTGLIAIGFVCPAMADPSNTGTFPLNGLMQQDYTYTNAATSENMDGVYEGTILAEAQYSDAGGGANSKVLVPKGWYLPAGADTPVLCPAGAFCTGLSNPVDPDENNAQGIRYCSTLSGGFTLSLPGAGSDTDCYKSCTASDVSHAMTVTGSNYYGGLTTCSADSCENGWKKGGSGIRVKGYFWRVIGNADFTSGRLISSENDLKVVFQYKLEGYNYTWSEYSYFSEDGFSFRDAWLVSSEDLGSVIGIGLCDTKASARLTKSTGIAKKADGTECWCKVFGYRKYINDVNSFKSLQAYNDTMTDFGRQYTPWVMTKSFPYDAEDRESLAAAAESCSAECPSYCLQAFMGNEDVNRYDYRRAMLEDAAQYPMTECRANRITITWDGASADDISVNDAGYCEYGGNIRTPRAAQEIPGKIFKGWRFKKAQQ